MILSIGDATCPLLLCKVFSAKWTFSLFLMYISHIMVGILELDGAQSNDFDFDYDYVTNYVYDYVNDDYVTTIVITWLPFFYIWCVYKYDVCVYIYMYVYVCVCVCVSITACKMYWIITVITGIYKYILIDMKRTLSTWSMIKLYL